MSFDSKQSSIVSLSGAEFPYSPATTVLVAHSDFAEATKKDDKFGYLLSAVSSFVNFMIEQGNYNRDEIHSKAILAWGVSFYAGEVSNGGHSQFVGSSYEQRESVWPSALKGLDAIGAEPRVECLRAAVDWATKHPAEAKCQSGFHGGCASELDDLDDNYFAEERKKALYALAAEWILSWPELCVLPDEQFSSVQERMALVNPRREGRIASERVRNFRDQLNDAPSLLVKMATHASVNVEMPRYMAKYEFEEPDGKKFIQFGMIGGAKSFVAVVSDTWTKVYAADEVRDQSDRQGIEPLASQKLGSLTNDIAKISNSEAASISFLAKELDAANVIDLLLTKHGQKKETYSLSAESGLHNLAEHSQICVLLYKFAELVFRIVIHKDGATLIETSDPAVRLHVCRQEVQAHADQLTLN